MKYSELYRILQKHGWTVKEGKRKGGHDRYVHPDYNHFILVARHPSQEVAPGTLHCILRQAGIE